MNGRHITFLLLSSFHCYALAESSGGAQLITLWNCFLGLIGLFLLQLLFFHGGLFIVIGPIVCLGVFLIGYSNSLVGVGIGVLLLALGGTIFKNVSDKDNG